MTTLVILAAGMARRFGGFKPLAPVGPHGEAVIDVTADQASRAGFDRIVIVTRLAMEGALSYHVARCWPSGIEVTFAVQDGDPAIRDFVEKHGKPPGTAHAVLVAAKHLEGPFGVLNGDDIYGLEALGTLAGHLSSDGSHHALVAYHLGNTVLTDQPVTRALCAADATGNLTLIDERTVRRQPDGTFSTAPIGQGDGPASQDPGHAADPLESVGPDVPVSVNCWGFQMAIIPLLEEAVDSFMRAAGTDVAGTDVAGTDVAGTDVAGTDAAGTNVAGTHVASRAGQTEVLLPEVIGAALGKHGSLPVRVLHTEDRCIGVTHPQDLALVQSELASLVATGAYPEQLWQGSRISTHQQWRPGEATAQPFTRISRGFPGS